MSAASARPAAIARAELRIVVDGVQTERAGGRSAADAARPRRPLAGRAEQLPDGDRAPFEQRDVVLPGVADAAEHRHAVQGNVAALGKTRDGGFGSGELKLLVVFAQRASRIPRRGREHLDAREDVRRLVFDGLERADLAAELLANLRVIQGGFEAPAGDAARFCCKEHGCRRAYPLGGETGQNSIGGDDGVDANAADAAGLIDGGQLLDGDAVVPGIEHHPDVAVRAGRADHQQFRAGRTEHGAGGSGDRKPVTLGDASNPATSVAQAAVAPSAKPRKAEAADCGTCARTAPASTVGNEGTGKQRAPGFLDDDGHRDPVGIVAAVRFGQVQGQQAAVEERLPVRRQLAGDEPLEALAGVLARGMTLRQPAHRARQSPMLLRQPDRHACSSLLLRRDDPGMLA